MPRQAKMLEQNLLELDDHLFQIENKINWLKYLSPTDNLQRWQQFKRSGYKSCPPLTYPRLSFSVEGVRADLRNLRPLDVGSNITASLLREKLGELELQVDLIANIDTPQFVSTSISLFGGTAPSLLQAAIDILDKTPTELPRGKIVGAEAVLAEANRWLDELRSEADDFTFTASIAKDLNSGLMVNHGHLLISNQLQVPATRVEPLIAHEVGVHIVTRYNGLQQPLKTLESGLTGYDALQEGIAVLSEYLAGYFPPYRLRMLAARVVATDLATEGESIEAIFEHLTSAHQFRAEDAFDTAVRGQARRWTD